MSLLTASHLLEALGLEEEEDGGVGGVGGSGLLSSSSSAAAAAAAAAVSADLGAHSSSGASASASASSGAISSSSSSSISSSAQSALAALTSLELLFHPAGFVPVAVADLLKDLREISLLHGRLVAPPPLGQTKAGGTVETIRLCHQPLLKSLRGVGACPSLSAVYVLHSGLVETNGLEQCPLLDTLWLTDNSVATLEPLAANAILRHVRAQSNLVEHLNGLERLAKLHTIKLAGNPIASLDDVALLGSLASLRDVSFHEAECSRHPCPFLLRECAPEADDGHEQQQHGSVILVDQRAYRRAVLSMLRQITVLDGCFAAASERTTADDAHIAAALSFSDDMERIRSRAATQLANLTAVVASAAQEHDRVRSALDEGFDACASSCVGLARAVEAVAKQRSADAARAAERLTAGLDACKARHRAVLEKYAEQLEEHQRRVDDAFERHEARVAKCANHWNCVLSELAGWAGAEERRRQDDHVGTFVMPVYPRDPEYVNAMDVLRRLANGGPQFRVLAIWRTSHPLAENRAAEVGTCVGWAALGGRAWCALAARGAPWPLCGKRDDDTPEDVPPSLLWSDYSTSGAFLSNDGDDDEAQEVVEEEEEEEDVASRSTAARGGASAAQPANTLLSWLTQSTLRMHLADACNDAIACDENSQQLPHVMPICLATAWMTNGGDNSTGVKPGVGVSKSTVGGDIAISSMIAAQAREQALSVSYVALVEPAPASDEAAIARLEAASSDMDVVGGKIPAPSPGKAAPSPDAKLTQHLDSNPPMGDAATTARLASLASGVACTHARPGDWLRDPWWELERRAADAVDPRAATPVEDDNKRPPFRVAQQRTTASTRRPSSDPRARPIPASKEETGRETSSSLADAVERQLAEIEEEAEALLRVHNAEARANLDAPLQRTLASLASEQAKLEKSISAHRAQLDVERDAQDDVIRTFQASVAASGM